MKQLKKYAIGYNTVSSKNGVISARGVKSYPNDLQIFGYTHEIGEGEKSPDNPHILQSLDSGNVNLYSEDKITDIVVTNGGAIRKGIELDASKFKSNYCTIYFDEENTSSNILNGGTSVGINIKFLYKNGTYETFTSKNHIKHIRIDKITEDVEKVIIYNAGGNLNAEYFSLYADLMILDSPIIPSEYITDEHSIVLSNNDKTIQVPVPVALHSVAGKSDILTKNGSIWGIKVRTSVFNSNDYIDTLKYHGESSTGTHVYRIGDISPEAELQGNISVCISNFLKIVPRSIDMDNVAKLFRIGDKKGLYIRYQHSLYPQFSSVQTLKEFLLENPIEIIFPADKETFIPLSDYAQNLLNFFELQNQNEIFVEGYPGVNISGYIQR